jgi:DNA-binding MarR family transcriptional regulator
MELVVNITEYGKKSAEDIRGSGLKYRALAKLYEQGTMNTSELAQELGISTMKANMVINALIREGKVREE